MRAATVLCLWLLATLLLLLAHAGCSSAAEPDPVTPTPLPSPMWCFAGTAPASAMLCADTEEQCERDHAAADLDAAWLTISPCKQADVYVTVREPSG